MAAVVATGAGKAVREDAALEVFVEGLCDVGGRGVVIALAVKLTCAGESAPSLEVIGDDAVEQRLLGMTGVVELG